MESLSYGFEACEPSFTDDIELQMDRLVNRNLLKGWDSEPLPTLVADGVYDIGIVEPFSPDEKRKSVLSNQCLGGSVDETDIDFGRSALSNSTVTLNSLAQFGRKISSSSINENFAHTELEMENSARVSSLNQISNENLGLSSREPPVSNKRARITNLQSQHPVCVVYGCNKDLSSLKDYHKRHKVCDIHAKTSVVIVNGTKQRFCQQCSRFHVLAEFDEDKRSCRKRLAGHNERRRKPQLDNHFGTDLSSASLLLSEIFPGVMFGKGPTSYSRNTLITKYEPTQTFQSALPSKYDLSLAKPVIHPSTTCLNAPLSVGSNSSCALSLLSQNSVTNSAGISMARPLIFKENLCTNFHGNLDFTTKSALSFLTPSAFNSSGEVEQGVSDTNISTGFEIPQNDFFQEANAFKCFPSPESADSVDLLQLSLHLQRVEQQKYSAQVKQENGVVYHSTIT